MSDTSVVVNTLVQFSQENCLQSHFSLHFLAVCYSRKRYSEAAIVEKEELSGIKSCFEELRTFLSMLGMLAKRFRNDKGRQETGKGS